MENISLHDAFFDLLTYLQRELWPRSILQSDRPSELHCGVAGRYLFGVSSPRQTSVAAPGNEEADVSHCSVDGRRLE